MRRLLSVVLLLAAILVQSVAYDDIQYQPDELVGAYKWPEPVTDIPIQALPPLRRDPERRKQVKHKMKQLWLQKRPRYPDNFYTINELMSAHSALIMMNFRRNLKKSTVHKIRIHRFSEDAIEFCATWSSQIVAGILSAYELSGKTMYKDIAIQLSKRSIPTLPDTAIPAAYFNRDIDDYTHIGGFILESLYMRRICEGCHSQFAQLADEILRFLRTIEASDHFHEDLYVWKKYEYASSSAVEQLRVTDDLLQALLATNGHHPVILNLLNDFVSNAIDSITWTKGRYIITMGLSMSAESCSLGGFFALLSKSPVQVNHKNANRMFLRIAAGITATCREAASLNKHRLPDWFVPGGNITNEVRHGMAPVDLAQSYFMLWRITHEPRYRDWGWDMFGAISTTVNHSPSLHMHFTTLKYLYLLFSDDSDFSLDEWVFNRAGFPFRRNL